MRIFNAKLILKNSVINGSIEVLDGKIVSIKEDVRCGDIDANGAYIAPGFVDLHSHGGGGHDFMDGTVEDIEKAAFSHLKHGTTTILPTTLTSSDEDLLLFLDNFKAVKKSSALLPNLPGIHLEGPYFSPAEKGAQDPRYLKTPLPEHYNMVMEKAEGSILRWTVAPELPGAIEMAHDLAGDGVIFSAGHTQAAYDEISRAYDAGYTMLTHFYSGMSTITRKGGFRILGAVESGYLIDDLYVELIADGLHLPPDLLRMIFKCKEHSHITACTDSMRGAGMPDGESILGSLKDGQKVIIEDGIAKMPDRTCFAGSVATGDRLFRTIASIPGVTLPEVSRILSLHPARAVHLDSEIGSLEVGKRADFVLLDNQFEPISVYVGGEIVK